MRLFTFAASLLSVSFVVFSGCGSDSNDGNISTSSSSSSISSVSSAASSAYSTDTLDYMQFTDENQQGLQVYATNYDETTASWYVALEKKNADHSWEYDILGTDTVIPGSWSVEDNQFHVMAPLAGLDIYARIDHITEDFYAVDSSPTKDVYTGFTFGYAFFDLNKSMALAQTMNGMFAVLADVSGAVVYEVAMDEATEMWQYFVYTLEENGTLIVTPGYAPDVNFTGTWEQTHVNGVPVWHHVIPALGGDIYASVASIRAGYIRPTHGASPEELAPVDTYLFPDKASAEAKVAAANALLGIYNDVTQLAGMTAYEARESVSQGIWTYYAETFNTDGTGILTPNYAPDTHVPFTWNVEENYIHVVVAALDEEWWYTPVEINSNYIGMSRAATKAEVDETVDAYSYIDLYEAASKVIEMSH